MGQALSQLPGFLPPAAHSLVGKTDYKIIRAMLIRQRPEHLAFPQCPVLTCFGSFNLEICHNKVLLLSSFYRLGNEVWNY